MWRLRYTRLNDCIGAWCPSRDAARGTMRLTDQRPARNHGTLTNMAADAWVLSPGAGGGYALNFDATNDYASCGTRQYLFASQPFTLTWWEYVISSTAYPARFRLTSNTNTFGVIRSTDASYATISFGEWRAVTGVKAAAPTLADSIGIWRHFAIVGNAGPTSTTPGDYLVFCDGVACTTSAASVFSTFAGATNQIGYDSLNYGANCLMDDIRIHSRVLTPSEIALLYRLGRGGAYALEYVPIGKAGAAPPATTKRQLLLTGVGR